jgi:hypothetical protein
MELGEEANDTVERVRILDGNLMKLEQTFAGSFKWNDIILDGPSFRKINRFDNAEVDICSDDHKPISQVLITYRKKKKRIKVNRCSDDSNNGITASSNVAVVINDTGVRTGVQQVARYLIFKNESKIKVVHILKFDTDDLKSKFYVEYHFDTVPILKLSDLLVPAKAWNTSNKVSRSYGGGGGGTRVMQYINVANESVDESEVSIRDIEDGGYFVEVGDKKKWVKLADKYNQRSPVDITGKLKIIVERLGIDLDRVYIINKQTSEAKWFKQAIESGEWINVWDYVRENLESLDPNTLLDAINYNEHCSIDAKNGKKISNGISNKNSPMLKLVGIPLAKNHNENADLVIALKGLYLWDGFVGNATGTVDFQKESDKVLETYPLLSEINSLKYHYDLDTKSLINIVSYINMTDLWNEKNSGKETA